MSHLQSLTSTIHSLSQLRHYHYSMIKPTQSAASEGEHAVWRKSQEPWILQWKGIIWALIWLILHFSNKAFFFFFKSWTKTHEKKIHSLNLQAYELLSSDKTKEINVQPGSNSISSYTVTPSLNLIHRTEENKQINSKKVKQPKKVRGVEWETQSVVSLMSWTSHRPEPWTHNVSTFFITTEVFQSIGNFGSWA